MQYHLHVSFRCNLLAMLSGSRHFTADTCTKFLRRNSIFRHILATRGPTYTHVHIWVPGAEGALKRKGRWVRALSPEGESRTFAKVPYPECLYRATLRSAGADGKFRPSSLSCDETNRWRRGVDTTGDQEHRH